MGPKVLAALADSPVDRALLIAGEQFFWCRAERMATAAWSPMTPVAGYHMGGAASQGDQRARITTTCVTVATVRAALEGAPIDSGWLPPHVVRWGTGIHGLWMAQFVPPMVRRVALIPPDAQTPVLWELPLPGLVFVGRAGVYRVWALREEVFSPALQLYHAPFPNIDGRGVICFGENTVPRSDGAAGTTGRQLPSARHGDWLTAAWNVFLSAPFNEHLSAGKSAQFPADVRRQWAALHASGATRYPVEDLRSADLGTVDQLFARLYGDEGGFSYYD